MKSFTPKFMLCKHGVFNLSWILNRNKFVFTFATNTFSKVGVKKPATCYRGCRPEVFCKKGFLKNFAKFTGKHLCQGFPFNKVAGLRPLHLWWLLLLLPV